MQIKILSSILIFLFSVHAASLAASRVEQALSEAASSLSSFSPRPGPQGAWMIQLKIWLLLADVYLVIDQPHEAMFCIQEASQIYPLSHHIMYMVRIKVYNSKIQANIPFQWNTVVLIFFLKKKQMKSIKYC